MKANLDEIAVYEEIYGTDSWKRCLNMLAQNSSYELAHMDYEDHNDGYLIALWIRLLVNDLGDSRKADTMVQVGIDLFGGEKIAYRIADEMLSGYRLYGYDLFQQTGIIEICRNRRLPAQFQFIKALPVFLQNGNMYYYKVVNYKDLLL